MSAKKTAKKMRTVLVVGWMLAGLAGVMATGCAPGASSVTPMPTTQPGQ